MLTRLSSSIVLSIVAATYTVVVATQPASAATNLALNKPATGSTPCADDEGPAKAFNGSVTGGNSDKWCSHAASKILTVDLGASVSVARFVVKHAEAGGETAEFNTRAFAISTSTNGTSFTPAVSVGANTAPVTLHNVTARTARFVRLTVTAPEQSGGGAARIYELEVYGPGGDPEPGDCHADAPSTLPDYISDHSETMTRITCTADGVAVYFNDGLRNIPSSRTAWIAPFLNDVWRHYKATYGGCSVNRDLPAPIGPGCQRFGEPKPLIAFLHEGRYHGGTVANRFDEFSAFRNTIDAGDDGWQEGNQTLRDVLTHEACHIVEGASQGVHESPAFGEIWGDSKWAEICQWDFYQRTGRTADASRTFQMFMGHRDDLPEGARDAAWFRDWFYPLWQQSGGNMSFMERFFGLLNQYFPKTPENNNRNLIYTRRMNAGEYVHFMSGAAGRDLSGVAQAAFNTGFSRAQFEEARRNFPGITY